MVSPSPKKRFVYVERPSEFEFNEDARVKIEKYIGPGVSKEKIKEFITEAQRLMRILEPEVKIELKSPRPQEVSEALNRCKKFANKLQNAAVNFQECIGELDIDSRRILQQSIPHNFGEEGNYSGVDQIANLDSQISKMILNINEFDRIRGVARRPKVGSYRRFANQLAKAFYQKLDLVPSKSRNGVFGNILKACLEASGHYKSDYFKLIKEAVDQTF